LAFQPVVLDRQVLALDGAGFVEAFAERSSKIAIGAAIGRGWFAADLTAIASGCLAVGGAAAWLTFAFLAP
jgi:hypothetical protein